MHPPRARREALVLWCGLVRCPTRSTGRPRSVGPRRHTGGARWDEARARLQQRCCRSGWSRSPGARPRRAGASTRAPPPVRAGLLRRRRGVRRLHRRRRRSAPRPQPRRSASAPRHVHAGVEAVTHVDTRQGQRDRDRRAHPGHGHRRPVGPGPPARRHGARLGARQLPHLPARRGDSPPHPGRHGARGRLQRLPAGRGRPARPCRVAHLRARPTRLRVLLDGHRQPDRRDPVGREQTRGPAARHAPGRSSRASRTTSTTTGAGSPSVRTAYLYATTGEAQQPALAQDKSSLGGKILRMTTAGRPPRATPSAPSCGPTGTATSRASPGTPPGASGPRSSADHSEDELNLIQPGRNYGWPQTEGRTTRPGITGPVVAVGPDRGLAERHRDRERLGVDGRPSRTTTLAHPARRLEDRRRVRRTSSSVATAGCAACSRSGRTPCS